jgi:hypothetical protein
MPMMTAAGVSYLGSRIASLKFSELLTGYEGDYLCRPTPNRDDKGARAQAKPTASAMVAAFLPVCTFPGEKARRVQNVILSEGKVSRRLRLRSLSRVKDLRYHPSHPYRKGGNIF